MKLRWEVQEQIQIVNGDTAGFYPCRSFATLREAVVFWRQTPYCRIVPKLVREGDKHD